MSRLELDRFAGAVKTDPGLQAELKKVAVSDQAIVEFARGKGYDIELGEVASYVGARKAEMSLKDLDAIAGGKSHAAHNTNVVGEAETVVAAVSVTTAVEVQDVTTTSTVAAEAECVIVAT